MFLKPSANLPMKGEVLNYYISKRVLPRNLTEISSMVQLRRNDRTGCFSFQWWTLGTAVETSLSHDLWPDRYFGAAPSTLIKHSVAIFRWNFSLSTVRHSVSNFKYALMLIFDNWHHFHWERERENFSQYIAANGYLSLRSALASDWNWQLTSCQSASDSISLQMKLSCWYF